MGDHLMTEMISVDSSNIAAVGYTDNSELIVQFHSGTVYKYHGVPRQRFLGLLSASSTGKFLNSEIKPFHECERIDG